MGVDFRFDLIQSGALAALIALSLWIVRRAKPGPVRQLFMLFLFLHGYHVVNVMLMAFGFPGWTVNLFQVPYIVNAALLPVTYLYLKKLTRNEYKWRCSDAWHLAIPLTVLGVMLPEFLEGAELRRANWKEFPSQSSIASRSSAVLIGFGLLGYLGLQYREYRRFYYESVASRDTRQSETIFRWIRWVNLMIFVFVACSLTYGVIPIGYQGITKFLLYLPIYGILGYLVQHSDVVKALPQQHVTESSPIPTTSTDLSAELRRRELFLDPELSVFRAALEFEMSPKYFSAEVKRQSGLNFSEWVNRARVERAKELLMSGALQRKTLEAVGQSSGFSSRSSFYRAFSAVEGCSPGTWVKSKF